MGLPLCLNQCLCPCDFGAVSVCIVHLHVRIRPYVFISSSCPALPPPAAAGVPASPVIPTPSSSSSLSARQLGSRPHGALGCRGLTFTLNLTPPLSAGPHDSYASDPIPAYYSLSSVHGWPCCCVKSQVQVPGRAGPCRVTPHHNRPDLAGSEDWVGRGECLVAHFLLWVSERWLAGGLGMG